MRPMRTKKTPEYTVPGNARKRDENIDLQEASVYSDSPELTVPENTRRFLQTKEDTIFTKVHRTVNIGKTSVFLHSRAFAVRENVRGLL